MKRLLLAVLLSFAAWTGYRHLHAVPRDALPPPGATPVEVAATAGAFACDGRTHCSQMTSRAEAEYFLQHCPATRMDGDRDGVPCENDSRF